MWAEEVKDGYCPNFASSPYTPSQLECQQRCIRKDGCVGISYGGRRLRRRLCYLCIDDSLKSLQNYRFYRLPGIAAVRLLDTQIVSNYYTLNESENSFKTV